MYYMYKYMLGQRVKDFTIVAMYHPQYFISKMNSQGSYDFSNLDFCDSDWKVKPVYVVLYDEPRRTNSIDDFQRLFPDLNFAEIKQMYDDQPLHQVQCLIESAIDEVAKEESK